ncbi:hypothetical protein THAOC_36778, partial [Thalassiosira oceanica]
GGRPPPGRAVRTLQGGPDGRPQVEAQVDGDAGGGGGGPSRRRRTARGRRVVDGGGGPGPGDEPASVPGGLGRDAHRAGGRAGDPVPRGRRRRNRIMIRLSFLTHTHNNQRYIAEEKVSWVHFEVRLCPIESA